MFVSKENFIFDGRPSNLTRRKSNEKITILLIPK